MQERIGKESTRVEQLGFGGGCHWCTEAVFEQLRGVHEVRQGWIKSRSPFDSFSEAVIVDYDREIISKEVLVQIHLLTHSSASDHSMREKYRSAVYYVDDRDEERLGEIIRLARKEDGENYLTKVMPLVEFQLNKEEFLHYYKTRPEAPFCQRHIRPKLRILMQRFGKNLKKSEGR